MKDLLEALERISQLHLKQQEPEVEAEGLEDKGRLTKVENK